MANHFSLRSVTLPSDWHDDTRMNHLYQPFREKSANPEGYDRKMNFWVYFVQLVCKETTTPVIDLKSLCSSLERKGKQPLCLQTVLEHMLNQGLIEPLSEFSKVEPVKSWLGWGFDLLVQKPLMWGFQSVQSVMNWSTKEDQFVVISVVKDLAKRLLLRHQDSVNSDITDHVLFLETFESQCVDICKDRSFDLAIIQLQKERLAHVFEDRGRKVIKFCPKGQNSVKPLTELERGILNLQHAKNKIMLDLDILEREVESCTSEIKQLLRTGSKTKAMLALKKKKRLEAVLNKKSRSLDNVESLICQLQNTDSEKMVLSAYKLGVDAMKATTKDDLNLDSIDTTMSDVEEALDDFSEIQKTLARPLYPEADENLEDELNEILSSEEKRPAARPEKSPEKVTDDDLLRRLNALRAPPEGSPPAKKPTIIKIQSQS